MPTLDRIAKNHSFIRGTLNHLVNNGGAVRILYGGSVKPDNVTNISRIDEVDGMLVGGASLESRDFLAISTAFAG
ncbi:triose-phosphate isomerase [Rhizobium sp. SYY.PMSO]|uniref:triose-phosphate isomerase n=1 Tax=Rhizobium sp. SYY.PMSO TaxID=3382192 RepID=UPI00398FD176